MEGPRLRAGLREPPVKKAPEGDGISWSESE